MFIEVFILTLGICYQWSVLGMKPFFGSGILTVGMAGAPGAPLPLGPAGPRPGAPRPAGGPLAAGAPRPAGGPRAGGPEAGPLPLRGAG